VRTAPADSPATKTQPGSASSDSMGQRRTAAASSMAASGCAPASGASHRHDAAICSRLLVGVAWGHSPARTRPLPASPAGRGRHPRYTAASHSGIPGLPCSNPRIFPFASHSSHVCTVQNSCRRMGSRKKLLLLQLAFWLVGIKDDNTTAPYPEPLSDQLDKSIVGGGLQLFEFSDHNAGFEVPGTFPPSHFDSASGMAPLPIKLRAIALATLAKTFTKTISIVAHGSLINKHVIVKN